MGAVQVKTTIQSVQGLLLSLRATGRSGMRPRLAWWLWLCLMAVYWGLGLPFSLRYLNYDAAQKNWIWATYLWEVPVLGLVFAIWPMWVGLAPVVSFLKTSGGRPAEAGQIRSLALALPLRLPPLVLGASLLGFGLGSLQLRAWADVPTVELVKNLCLGLPTGLLSGLLTYFILAEGLRPVIQYCDTLMSLRCPRQVPPLTVFGKVLACLLVISIVSISVMGLMSYTSSQRLLEDELRSVVPQRLAELVRADQPTMATDTVLGLPMQWCRVSPHLLSVALPQDAEFILGDQGLTVVRRTTSRLVAWQRTPDGRMLVAVLPLAGALAWSQTTVQETVLVGLCTLGVAMLLALAVAWNLGRPVQDMAAMLATRGEDGLPAQVPIHDGDDELGELSRALRILLDELKTAQVQLAQANFDLRHKVQQRTREMREAAALFEVSRALTSSLQVDRVLNEVVTQVRELTEADGCSMLLKKHDWLELRASSGLDAELLPAALSAQELGNFDWYRGRPQVLRINRLPAALREALQAQGFQVMIACPLFTQRSLLGLLAVYYRHPDVDLERDLNLLLTVGGQAAVAIENARLYEDQQHVTNLLRGILAPREALGMDGVEVGHRFVPSMLLSGDYYDIIPLREHRFGVVIADVAGKGPDAAIITARAKHIISAYATAGFSPARTLELLNQQLVGTAEDLHLVTVFYAEVDLLSKQLTYASAGHEPPLLWSPDRLEPQALVSDGVLAGVTVTGTYREHILPFEAGTCLLLYTDGVTEARDAAGQFFGQQGMRQVIAEVGSESPQQVVNHIYVAANRFCQGHFTDDVSLLVIRLTPVA
ncbi:MAG TPA: SpoIIE family protein phosphatase [Candidatus Xenobia bacterium]|jgi:serine phosphatase RsbU (regulator of sigma subunit)